MNLDSNDRFKLRVFMNTLEMLPHIWPTPLVRLRSLSTINHDAWAKLEFFNPFSRSIKDRTVWYMITRAIEKCIQCRKLYEATSGNVGIAMASISNILGIEFKAYLPETTPKLTINLLKILGADIEITRYHSITPEMIDMVKKIAEKHEALNLNQFINDNNFLAHYNYTAKELEMQLETINRNPPKAIIAGIGTSGHISALSKYFKEKYGDKVKIIGVIPRKGETIPGIKRIESKPKWLQEAIVDEIVEITREEAIRSVIDVARREGLLIGLSAGAVVTAYNVMKDIVGKGTYVLMFPDDIFKYIDVVASYLENVDTQKLSRSPREHSE